MSGIIDQTIQKSLHMTLARVGAFSAALANASAASRSQSFRQWLDFSQPGKVQHLHVQHLEWLYGSVYRKHTRHVLLLYDFDVAQTQLKSAHRAALDAFTLGVVFPHYLNVNRGREGFARHFEYYSNPFAVNVSLAQKHSFLVNQSWAGDIGRDDALNYAETERYRDGGTLRAPFDRFDTFFAVPDPGIGVADLQPLNAGESRKFVQGRISELHFRQYMPFFIDKLLNLGPAEGSLSYPFEAITGHASSTGPDAQNDTLSQQRAETAVSYLHTLLSNHCADFAHVNPELAANVQALGSQAPIWGVDGEVEENRSVKLVFETAYDYVHVQDETDLSRYYGGRLATIRNELEKYVDHGKAWRRALDNGEPFEPDYERKTLLNQLMRDADHRLALGVSTLKFAQRYRGDFATLAADGTLASIPPRVNSPAFFQYATPEGYTTERMLPIPFLLQHGAYSENNGHKYNLPVSAEDKLAAAAPILTRYIQEYSSYITADAMDVIGVRQRLDAMGRLIQEDYASFYSKDPITAHSFLLTEFIRRQEFEAALDNQDTKLQVEYQGSSIEVPILHYRFITTAMKEHSGDAPYYWYDQGLLNVQVAAKAQLAPLVVAADVIFKDIRRDTLQAAGMSMTSIDDLYFLLETYFWVWNMD